MNLTYFLTQDSLRNCSVSLFPKYAISTISTDCVMFSLYFNKTSTQKLWNLEMGQLSDDVTTH